MTWTPANYLKILSQWAIQHLPFGDLNEVVQSASGMRSGDSGQKCQTANQRTNTCTTSPSTDMAFETRDFEIPGICPEGAVAATLFQVQKNNTGFGSGEQVWQ